MRTHSSTPFALTTCLLALLLSAGCGGGSLDGLRSAFGLSQSDEDTGDSDDPNQSGDPHHDEFVQDDDPGDPAIDSDCATILNDLDACWAGAEQSCAVERDALDACFAQAEALCQGLGECAQTDDPDGCLPSETDRQACENAHVQCQVLAEDLELCYGGQCQDLAEQAELTCRPDEPPPSEECLIAHDALESCLIANEQACNGVDQQTNDCFHQAELECLALRESICHDQSAPSENCLTPEQAEQECHARLQACDGNAADLEACWQACEQEEAWVHQVCQPPEPTCEGLEVEVIACYERAWHECGGVEEAAAVCWGEAEQACAGIGQGTPDATQQCIAEIERCERLTWEADQCHARCWELEEQLAYCQQPPHCDCGCSGRHDEPHPGEPTDGNPDGTDPSGGPDGTDPASGEEPPPEPDRP